MLTKYLPLSLIFNLWTQYLVWHARYCRYQRLPVGLGSRAEISVTFASGMQRSIMLENPHIVITSSLEVEAALKWCLSGFFSGNGRKSVLGGEETSMFGLHQDASVLGAQRIHGIFYFFSSVFYCPHFYFTSSRATGSLTGSLRFHISSFSAAVLLKGVMQMHSPSSTREAVWCARSNGSFCFSFFYLFGGDHNR